MINSGYKKIVWGVLISGLHINIGIGLFALQIVPQIIGFYILYTGIKELHNDAGLEYMDKLEKDAFRLMILSGALWIYGFIFGYTGAVSRGITICFELVELMLYGDLLNKTVKYYKENQMEKEADKLRKNRMNFIKAFIALLVLQLAGMVVTVLVALDVADALSLVIEFIDYTSLTLMFMVKIWLTMMIQKLTYKAVE